MVAANIIQGDTIGIGQFGKVFRREVTARQDQIDAFYQLPAM